VLLANASAPAQVPNRLPPASWRDAVDQPAEDSTLDGEGQSQPAPTMPPPNPGGIRLVQAQRPVQPGPTQGGIPGPKTQETTYYGLLVSELPSPERLFQLDSEPALNERMRQDWRDRGDTKVVFPEEPVLTRDGFVPRHWTPKYTWAEPNYVCYNRLFFEQPNAERWGWDFGFIHPFVSAGWFFADVLTLPYHAGSDPCRCYECNAGYCLPGDPVPYRLYPPGLSATGLLAEAAVVTGLFLIFP
jgi:hypothetical protein